MADVLHIVRILLPYFVAGLAAATLAVAFWSLSWPMVKGRVDVSILETSRSMSINFSFLGRRFGKKNRDEFAFAYSYTVNEITYTNDRFKPLIETDWAITGGGDNGPDLWSSSRDKASWYQEGATVDVTYCPALPSWSCLEPGGFPMVFILGVTSIILFFVMK